MLGDLSCVVCGVGGVRLVFPATVRLPGGEYGVDISARGLCGPLAAGLAAVICGDLAADEREDCGEGDEAGIGAGQGGGAGVLRWRSCCG